MSDNISKPLVQHLSKLASLQLTDDQINLYQSNLSSIMDYMDQIKKLDLKSVSETFRTSEEENVWRDDEIKASFTQTQALANAMSTYQGYFLVPLVLTGKE